MCATDGKMCVINAKTAETQCIMADGETNAKTAGMHGKTSATNVKMCATGEKTYGTAAKIEWIGEQEGSL